MKGYTFGYVCGALVSCLFGYVLFLVLLENGTIEWGREECHIPAAYTHTILPESQPQRLRVPETISDDDVSTADENSVWEPPAEGYVEPAKPIAYRL